MPRALSTIAVSERRDEIVQMALALGRVGVATLATHFGVSEVTIRSDLIELDRLGMLARRRGGAIASARLSREQPLMERRREHSTIKRRIAEAARALIRDGDAIILDSGTTTAELAASMTGFNRLMVMTNGLNVAQNLTQIDGVEVLITGGKLRKLSQSLFGPHAEESFSRYYFDKLFLGVDGIDFNVGITTHFEYEAILNRRMCASAKQVIALTDSSKFNRNGVHKICNFDGIDVLITDRGIPAPYLDALRDAKVEVIIVDQAGEG